jgi:steroid 5-alpha reductase family enzyme
MLQALLSGIVFSPLFLIHLYPQTQAWGTFTDYLGLVMWWSGFFIEAIADFQKNSFKSDPQNRGKVLKTGLWKYSRHPNYFGEALLWWGVFFIVWNHVPFYLACIGPLLLNFFLIKVSGVSMLEQKYKGNVEYGNYQRTTNAFIPWLPKSKNMGP